jgi:hypothetical protein
MEVAMSTDLTQLNEILASENEDRLQQLADFAASGLKNGVGADTAFRELLG